MAANQDLEEVGEDDGEGEGEEEDEGEEYEDGEEREETDINGQEPIEEN